MATADKKTQQLKSVQRAIDPGKALLFKRIFCIVLIAFGAFAACFGIMSILKADAYVAAAAEKEMTFSNAVVVIFSGVLAAAGLCKVYVGIDSLTGKRVKAVNIVNIVNISLVVLAFIVIYNLSGAHMAVMICDLILSIVALCWLNAKLARYLREMFGELKKLTWLSGKDLASHTLAVFVFVIVLAVVIWALDFVFSTGFGAIAKINIG